MNMTSRSTYWKAIIVLDVVLAPIFLGINLGLIKTCGGFLNVWYCIGATAILIILASLIASLLLWNSRRNLASLIFIFNIGTFLAAFATPPEFDFQLLKPAYEESIKLVRSGQIETQEGILPFPYQLLSACGGRFISSQTNEHIFFYEMHDWFSFSGYLYSADGSLPQTSFFGYTSTEKAENICSPIATHWFFCRYHD